jgi:hypothetical protein
MHQVRWSGVKKICLSIGSSIISSGFRLSFGFRGKDHYQVLKLCCLENIKVEKLGG